MNADVPGSEPAMDGLSRLVRRVVTDESVDEIFERVVQAAVAQIDGASHAGITLLGRTGISTPVASDEVVREVDRQQYAIGEGPCVSAALDLAAVVEVADLREDQRWPAFSAAVSSLGVRAMLSFKLYTDAGVIGALNVYARRPGRFSEDSVQTGSLLASYAAVGVAARMRNENLKVALASRDVIGQAKGILMERFKITAEEAFGLLIARSQDTNRKLRDVAEHLAATGELLPSPTP